MCLTAVKDNYHGYIEFCVEAVEKFGVSLVGGCCGCGPDGIERIARQFHNGEKVVPAGSDP